MNTDRPEPTPTVPRAEAHAIEAEVAKTFLAFLHTTGQRGEGVLEQVGAMFHPDFTGFGTGAHERYTSRQSALSFTQQEHDELPGGFTVDVDWVEVHPLAAAAAMAECEGGVTMRLSEESTLTMPCRVSMVLVLQDGAWLLRHGHVSFPSSDQAADEVFPVDALRARNQQLERQVAERTAALEAAKHEAEVALADLQVTQAQLIQQEKLASLGQLTAGIAHEIKNPLNFVNNFAEINEELVGEAEEALDEGNLEEVRALLGDLKQNASRITHHGQRADAIVRSMMQHASSGSGEREAVDVNDLLDAYVNLAHHGRQAQEAAFSCEIERDYDEAVGRVVMVPREMGRVFLNVLSNAFDAVQEQEDAKVAVSTRETDGCVEIRVCDNGPGIQAAIKDKIFEPFFTTKSTGSGLGLSLSYDIITQGHGGTLTVESAEGQGATFIIMLPGAIVDD